MIIAKKYFGVILVLILSFWAIKPLFVPGFFPMHDNTQVARVFEMGKVLSTGTIPVRWVPDLGYGYGYPLFNFYAPLAYYVGGFFTLLNFDALISAKVMMAIGIVFAGISMYLLARQVWGEVGGIVSAVFYMYAPYHAVDIYVRGDVAEFWAYAFIPLVFYSLIKLTIEVRLRHIIVGMGAYSGVILSHNLTAMMVTPFMLIASLLLGFIAYREKKHYVLRSIIYVFVMGILLSTFYWLPALAEMKYTNVLSQVGGGADFRNHFLCIFQLWESHWGFGGSTPTCFDGMSFKVGKLHLIFSALAVLLFFSLKIAKKNRAFSLFLIFGLITSLLLTLEVSRPIWEAIPFMDFFQYPWRFLLLISFFSSVLVGFVPSSLNQLMHKPKGLEFKYIIGIGLVVSLLYFNVKLFEPQTILGKYVLDYTSEFALKWTTSVISDEYLPKNVIPPQSYDAVPKINIQAENMSITVENHKKLFEISSNKLPQLQFEETNIERMANIISIIGIVVLLAGIIVGRKRLI